MIARVVIAVQGSRARPAARPARHAWLAACSSVDCSTILCARCALKEAKTCTTAIVVKEGDKEVTYYFKDKGNKEAYHEEVCGGARKEGIVTGTVTEKDGRKWITPRKVEYARKKADRPARFAGGKWQQGEVLFRQNCASCHGANRPASGFAKRSNSSDPVRP